MRNTTTTVVIAAGAILAAPANAGPNFIEGMCSGDAGSNPAGACTVGGFGNVASISGSTSLGFGPGTADLEDLYLIFISDPENFSASVGPGTGFDTQLWLFRAEPGVPTIDGLGLLANDDVTSVDAGAMLGPMSDDGTGISLTTPGLYYLAISGGGGLGVPDPGRFPIADGVAIFEFLVPTEISGPDGPGCPKVIEGWMGAGEVGSYDIALEGVSFIAPPCPCDCEEVPDGSVGINDFLSLLANWGPCPDCVLDIDCDDGDPCTTDTCVAGQCVNTPIVPCCGNGIVEPGEDCDGPDDAACPGQCQDDCTCSGGPCGDPKAGDCCIANGTPGCNDAKCCSIVCAIDPFCCDLSWDPICAGEAQDLCPGCAQSNCCSANPGVPGCDDPACETIVCAQFPFCCILGWDQLCADAALAMCAVCGPTS